MTHLRLSRRTQSAMGQIAIAGLFMLAFAPGGFSQASLLDPSFVAAGSADGLVSSILVQQDGKILVGGFFSVIAGQPRPNLARLQSDGQLDPSLPAGTDGPIYRLLQQPDGKILVGGSFSNLLGVARHSIGRILTNGTVDPTFDAETFPGSEKTVFSLGLQTDGKILVGNLAGSGELFRLNTNGTLDGSFVQTNIFNNYYIFAICPLTNGSILVGGGFQAVNGFVTPGLARLGSDGRLDTNYISGLQTNSNPSVILESAQGVLVGGRQWRVGDTNKLVVARLTADLGWDEGFQPDNFDPDFPSFSYVRSLLVQPDGKLVLGGNFQQVGGYWRHGIVRLDAQGKVDPCFDSGIGFLDDTTGTGVLTVARQSDGKILTGGHFHFLSSSPVGSLWSGNLVRLLPQSDCGATRTYLARLGPGQGFVAGTCAPGGTNHLQWSTNLMDWETAMSTPGPFLYYNLLPGEIAATERMFFRVKKEF